MFPHEGPCGLTLEFTGVRKRAQPAVARPVQRWVSPLTAEKTSLPNSERALRARTVPEGAWNRQATQLPIEGRPNRGAAQPRRPTRTTDPSERRQVHRCNELAHSRALGDGDCSVRDRGVHELRISAQRANV